MKSIAWKPGKSTCSWKISMVLLSRVNSLILLENGFGTWHAGRQEKSHNRTPRQVKGQIATLANKGTSRSFPCGHMG